MTVLYLWGNRLSFKATVQITFAPSRESSLRFLGQNANSDSVKQDAFQSGKPGSTTLKLQGEEITVSWREFGDPASDNVIFCAHGLSRNGQDFAPLARYLVARNQCRVIYPDFVGRGDSQWFQKPNKSLLARVAEMTQTNVGFYFRYLNSRLQNPFANYFDATREALDVSEEHRWQLLNAMNKSKYNPATYERMLIQLFEHLGLQNKNVTWVGTSMGGMMGVLMASQPHSPIKRLILNDIGPEVHLKGLRELSAMTKTQHPDKSQDVRYRSIEDVKTDFKNRYAGFGELSDSQWDTLARASVVQDKRDGLYRLNFDPAIVADVETLNRLLGKIPAPLQAVMNHLADTFLDPWVSAVSHYWHRWDKIDPRVETLILRGAESEILPRHVADRMRHRRPNVDVIEIPKTAHAPSLLPDEQLEVINHWLQQHPGKFR